MNSTIGLLKSIAVLMGCSLRNEARYRNPKEIVNWAGSTDSLTFSVDLNHFQVALPLLDKCLHEFKGHTGSCLRNRCIVRSIEVFSLDCQREELKTCLCKLQKHWLARFYNACVVKCIGWPRRFALLHIWLSFQWGQTD